MRFVLAIAAFLVAAVMIGFGIAQRTVFLDPDRVTASVELEDPTAFVVISPEALAAYPGKQTLLVSGGTSSFLAYGRTADVEGWLGDGPYTRVGFDAQTASLSEELVEPAEEADGGEPESDAPAAPSASPEPPAGGEATTEAAATPGPSPAGSDLWLEERSSDGPLNAVLDLPEGISVLVAADGTEPAPDRIRLSWPLDNATPWVGPLLVGGGAFFLLGAVLLVSGFVSHRRGRGPRRKGPRPGKLPTGPKPTSIRRNEITGSRGRRSIGRVTRVGLLSLGLVPALALTACSSDYWPSFDAPPSESAAPTPTAPADGDDTEAQAEGDEGSEAEIAPPAVTEPQMQRIMRAVSGVAGDADAGRDDELLQTRFAGPALEARQANYAIRGVLPDQALPIPVPAEPLQVVLPEQARGWPRTVFVVAKNGADPTVAPTALVLTQADPRSNYEVDYAMAMAPDTESPKLAPASIGAPRVSADNKGLVMPPAQVAAAYADLLQTGDGSQYAPLFEAEGDDLLTQLGIPGQQQTQSESPPTATISFSTVASDGPTIALGTVDAGALVVGTIEQTEKAVPNDGGTIAFTEGGPRAALSGFTGGSAKGVQHTTGVQVLFYVPAVGSDEKIRVLGWSESLIAASEVP